MVIHDISSRSNPRFRTFAGLLSGQGVKRYGLSLLSGLKQVREVLREFPDRCDAVVFGPRHSLPIPEGMKGYRLGKELFREIDVYGTGEPVLLVRAGPLLTWNSDNRASGCTLLIPFQDPANVGAVIRSAAAFGVAGVVVLKEAAHPFHHKSLKVAGSAVFRVPLFAGPSLRELPSERFPLITLSSGGMEISRFAFPETFGLVPGLEGPGLPSSLQGLPSLSIPMEGGVESLNAATATAIALYVWRSKSKKE
jgi:tRNA G18 (ribose-2'-O)-methylase SpoU